MNDLERAYQSLHRQYLDLGIKMREYESRLEQAISWVSCGERLPPKKDAYYFVWVPEWDGYGNIAHADMCWWDGHHFSLGCLPSVEDGAFVSHWAEIVDPESTK